MSVIGTAKCDCGGTVKYSDTKTGGISGTCDQCAYQAFHRSPKAVESLKRRLAGSAPKPPEGDKEPAAAGEGFNLGKL
jgi:hypothetical protein